jgi:hypothetical protein
MGFCQRSAEALFSIWRLIALMIRVKSFSEAKVFGIGQEQYQDAGV